MDDEVGVRVCDGFEDFGEKAQARFDAEAPHVAMAVDRLAFDVLEHEVRLPGRRHASVEQARDVWIGEPRWRAWSMTRWRITFAA